MNTQIATVRLQGFISTPPTLRYRPATCVPVASLSVAVQPKEGGWINYFDVVVVGEGAEDVAANFVKDQFVRVDGTLSLQRWTPHDTQRQRMVVEASAIVPLSVEVGAG